MNKFKIKSLLLGLAITSVAFIPTAFAATSNTADFAKSSSAELVPCGSSTNNHDCTWNDLIQLGNNAVNLIVFLSSMFGVLGFCYAGFLYITATGDGGKIEQAHHIFKAVLTGMIFVLCGWLLIATILQILVGNSQLATSIKSFVDYSSVKVLPQGK